MGRLTMHRVALRELTVVRTEAITPRMRRIVLGGEQLGAFTRDGFACDPFITQSPEDHVKLFFAPAAGEPVVLPQQSDGKLIWTEAEGAEHRDYTVRRFDRGGESGAAELTIDIVLHEGGLGAEWAASAAVGDTIYLGGPKASLNIERTEHVVLWVDLTGLPAAARWCEEAPLDTRLTVLVEAIDESDRIELVRSDGSSVEASWTFGGEQATLNDPLGEDVFVFAAGETSRIKAIRTQFTGELGLKPAQFKTANYW